MFRLPIHRRMGSVALLAAGSLLSLQLSACGGSTPPEVNPPSQPTGLAASSAPVLTAEPNPVPDATGGGPTATTPAPVPAPAPSAVDPKPKQAVVPPQLPKGTVVLHVGASMADALGKDLRKELEKRGVKNILKYKEATYIPTWAGAKMGLGDLVRYHKPDLVIVTLGGNETAMPDPTIRAKTIKRLIANIGDRPCIWVGTPLWPGAPHTGILDVIRKNASPCRYVDTNVLIPHMDRVSDGIHPTMKERRRWARFMYEWLRHNRQPDGKRPWDFKATLEKPPESAKGWD